MARRRRIDYSWGPGHGPVSGVLNAAGAACATTMVADLINAADLWPTAPLWGLGAGAGAAAVSAAVAAWQYMPGRAVCYRAVCWLGAGLWSAAAITGNPWSLHSLGTLGLGAGGAIAVGLALTRDDRREEAKRRHDEEQARRQAEAAARPPKPVGVHEEIAAVWVERILRVTGISVRIIGVELWPGDPMPGYTLDIKFPPGGVTWRKLQGFEDGLASDVPLPEGCNVEVGQGADRGSALMRVETHNALADEKPYPRNYQRESINDPRLIAYFKDSSEARFNLRQEVVLAIGPTGSGKTTLMNALIAEHLKCVDVIPCVIDFNGGSLALPWLLAWRKDPQACPRPPISFVADTPAKALVLTERLLEIAKDRKPAYAHLKIAANETLLPISAELPQWTIFVDEVAEILGIHALQDPIRAKVAANLLELQRIGRDSGVRLVIAALGATNATLSDRQVKIHARVKIAMAATPQDEQYYLFDETKLPADDIAYPGAARIKLNVDPCQVGKIPNLRPDQISEISIATSDRRPDPDARGLAILGDVWSDRWKQSAELLALLDAGAEAIAAMQAGEPGTAAGPLPARPETPNPPQGAHVEASDLPTAMANLQDALAAMRQAAADAEPASPPGPPPAFDNEPPKADDPVLAELNAILAATPDPDSEPKRPSGWSRPPAAAPEQGRPGAQQPSPWSKPPAARKHPRHRMRELVAEARENGITPGQVLEVLKAEGYTTVLQTVTSWMRDDAQAKIIAQPGGDRTPYFPARPKPGLGTP